MTKEKVIFIPGFMCDERLFDAQTAALTGAGYECSAGALNSGSVVTYMARDILQDAPETFALVGLSMGGIVALEIMRQSPNRVSHLALLNTTPLADQSHLMRKEHIRRVANGELSIVLQEELKPQYLAPAHKTPEILSLIADMGEALGPDVFTQQSVALLIRQSMETVLDTITCPTLILTGEDDTVCPPALHRQMAERVKHATLEILPNCGHLSTLEQPQKVSRLLLSLLESDTVDIKAANDH